MGIDLTERMQALYDALGEAGLLEQVKVRFYPSQPVSRIQLSEDL